jgi:hypothetical protein
VSWVNSVLRQFLPHGLTARTPQLSLLITILHNRFPTTDLYLFVVSGKPIIGMVSGFIPPLEAEGFKDKASIIKVSLSFTHLQVTANAGEQETNYVGSQSP